MSTGLLALLDDVAAIAKATAASLDDVAAQAGAAGSKATGVVIDDAAVAPKYVVGLSPKRELPIVWNIAKGSLKNKLLYLIPAALILGLIAPWMIMPILVLGGLYLCFEGYEKLHEAMHKITHKASYTEEIKRDNIMAITPEELEKKRTSSAIRTDLILSAEIIAISYAVIIELTLIEKAIILAVIAIGVTFVVYGAVALIVKADDFGIHLAKNGYYTFIKAFGRGIINAMPAFLKILGTIGTAAMLWVGGGIVIHNTPFLHQQMEQLIHILHLTGSVKWGFEASISALFGIAMGALAEKAYKTIKSFTS